MARNAIFAVKKQPDIVQSSKQTASQPYVVHPEVDIHFGRVELENDSTKLFQLTIVEGSSQRQFVNASDFYEYNKIPVRGHGCFQANLVQLSVIAYRTTSKKSYFRWYLYK